MKNIWSQKWNVLAIVVVFAVICGAVTKEAITVNGTLGVDGSLSETLSGTVAVTNGSASVTGTGTFFTAELMEGDAIKLPSSVSAGYEIFTVSSIASDTALTLDSNYQGSTNSGLYAWKDPNFLTIDNGDGINVARVDKSGNLSVKGTATIGDYTLPNTDGTNGQVLGTDGSGTVSWKDASGSVYYDRGDPSAYDFQVGSFTKDGTWHDLDLSSIVPAGATRIHLWVCVEGNAAELPLEFRKNGNTNTFNGSVISTQVANVWNAGECTVTCDSDRKIEYRTYSGLSAIYVTVRGWWK